MELVVEKDIQHKHIVFSAFMFAFLALFFGRDILGITVSPVVFLALSFAICLCGNKSELLSFGVSLAALSMGFQYKYALIICMIAYIIKYPREIRLKKVSLFFLLLLVWELLHSFFGTFSLVEFFRGFAEFAFLTFLASISYKKIEHKIIARTFVICTLAMSIIILLSAASTYNYDIARMYLAGYRLGWIEDPSIEYAIYTNPNTLGLLCNAVLAVIGIEYLDGDKSKVNILASIVLTIIGVLTLSRTFWLVLFSLGVLLIFFNRVPIQRKAKNATIFFFMICFSLLLIYYISPEVVARTFLRFDASDNAGGRIELFLYYWNYIFSSAFNFFFGVGLQNSELGLELLMGIMTGSVSHNGIQQLFLLWGIGGFLLFVKFIQELFFGGKFHVDYHYILFFMLLVYIQAGQLITSGTTLMVLALSYILIRNNNTIVSTKK